jgi:ABC-type molybdenum transport system ATPase subunit/photorepair protein PhrA
MRKQTFEQGSEFLRGCRAWKIRLRQHHLIDKAAESFDKTTMILVAHHPKDKDHRAGRMRSIRAREVVG